MDKDFLKEKINSIRSEMNYFWTGILVTFGGAASFCTMEYKNTFTFIFIITGFTMSAIFINAFITRRIELIDILKKLEMEGKNEPV